MHCTVTEEAFASRVSAEDFPPSPSNKASEVNGRVRVPEPSLHHSSTYIGMPLFSSSQDSHVRHSSEVGGGVYSTPSVICRASGIFLDVAIQQQDPSMLSNLSHLLIRSDRDSLRSGVFNHPPFSIVPCPLHRKLARRYPEQAHRTYPWTFRKKKKRNTCH